MSKKSEFTFYWRDGKRNVFPGKTPEDALNKAGFGAGAVRALEFWSPGDCDQYAWNAAERDWKPTAAWYAAVGLPSPMTKGETK